MNTCPLCIEELDDADKLFVPCKCGYQICMWCWHRIREHHDGLCPNCRTTYSEIPNHLFNCNGIACDASSLPPHLISSPSAMEKQAQDDRKRTRRAVKRNKSEKKSTDQNRRVIVPNVVYLVGLPENISRDEILSQPTYLGQYGHVYRIIVHRNPEKYRDTCTAHVTFFDEEAARRCIEYLNGFQYQGKTIQAFIGTTKYPEDITPVDQSLRPLGDPIRPEHPAFPLMKRFALQEIPRGFEMQNVNRQTQMGSSVIAPRPPLAVPPGFRQQTLSSGMSQDLCSPNLVDLTRSQSGSQRDFVGRSLPCQRVESGESFNALARPVQNMTGQSPDINPKSSPFMMYVSNKHVPSPRGVPELSRVLQYSATPSLEDVVLGTGGLYSYIWSSDVSTDDSSWMGSPTSTTDRKSRPSLQIGFVPTSPVSSSLPSPSSASCGSSDIVDRMFDDENFIDLAKENYSTHPNHLNRCKPPTSNLHAIDYLKSFLPSAQLLVLGLLGRQERQ